MVTDNSGIYYTIFKTLWILCVIFFGFISFFPEPGTLTLSSMQETVQMCFCD